MAMFDDPRQSLERMQKELLEEEEDTEYLSEDEWWDTEMAEAKALIGMEEEEEETEVYRNYANGYGTRNSKTQVREDYRDTEDPEAPPRNQVRGQLILTFLLLLGILAVAGYWVSILL